MIDLDTLEAAARAATPGPWVTPDTGGHDTATVETAPKTMDSKDCWTVTVASVNTWRDEWQANARLIAAANPAAVLALIAELRQARAMVERMKTDERITAALDAYYDMEPSTHREPWLPATMQAMRAAIDAAMQQEQQG